MNYLTDVISGHGWNVSEGITLSGLGCLIGDLRCWGNVGDKVIDCVGG